MTLRLPSRRAALLGSILLGLAGCSGGDDPPRAYAPLTYSYLPRLTLQVSAVEIDDSWAPKSGTREVGNLAPTPPVEALRQMAHDRLAAGGPPGRAVFAIDDASIVEVRNDYVGRFVVHLDVMSSDGTRSGYAEARVSRTQPIGRDTPNAQRAELASMVDKMMADMNVEFEFQVRRSLRSFLMGNGPAAPQPQPIQTETLSAPTAAPVPATPAAAPAAPGAAAGTDSLSPPPAPLGTLPLNALPPTTAPAPDSPPPALRKPTPLAP